MSGIAYSFVVFEIARHPDAQRRLCDELLGLEKHLKVPHPQGPTDIPSSRELESLPYLNAVIKESLRLRGTLPTPNPRLTPKGKLTTIGGYKNIPGGVRINSFAWCLHRNEAVYPNPEEWKPERWLGDRDTRKEQERWFWTFGSGSRMCLGDNLAMESKCRPVPKLVSPLCRIFILYRRRADS